ncbi:MAG: FtsX-like permease family protein [Chloroflexi bacterium]|jgi:putative ABC transport system permease protein|nr:FtsX-like permease family protein [Chloroflexota bacterium]
MNILEAFLEALETLSANKLRSGLTILGIVIGVAAVIAMLAIGEGAQSYITGTISDLGTNLIFVVSGNSRNENRNIKPLTEMDAKAMVDSALAPDVLVAEPYLTTRMQVTYGSEKKNTSIDGVTPNYVRISNYEYSEGTGLTEEHILGQASVAVVGVDVADKLFERREGLVGETIRIQGQPFRIVGVLKPKGGGMGGSQDDLVMIPFSTAQSRLIRRNSSAVDAIVVQAASAETVNKATEDISNILRTRHRSPVGSDDFQVISQQSAVSMVSSITNVLTVFLGGIAAISLLVGGIGIMNIMLVSVTERTREIGLRKALGAKKSDILIQFLVESALLSLFGGIIGIVLGWLIAFVVGKVAAATGTEFTPEVGLNAILLATLFSTAVGLFFGIYPANRAASLQPVEALRHE